MLTLERVIGIVIAVVILASQYGSLSALGNYKPIGEEALDSKRLKEVTQEEQIKQVKPTKQQKQQKQQKKQKQVKSVAPAHIQMTDMLEQYIELHHEKTVSRAKLLKYVRWVVQYSKDTDIDSVWILAMMWQESRMLEKSVSSHGAIGLLQILPSTAKSFGVSKEELHQPETNIRTSIIYLEYLMDKYDGNLRKATIAYNQGEGNVDKGKARPWYYNQVKEHHKKMLGIIKKGQ
ncbi:soluble lytic murein transglycosylase-like protein [Paenibacillus sp. W4I10]|uniref:lytic transglycosylase domain-containing protein n=1 Tax=Paenibacillus sp. W4I10 TaxID=3042298 RepID=UPI002789A073|nr:lytic transglycosylase domain-containing protein [Paenibacillus sp. W4I10]MDQ0719400.1 soluble lytic murein transglycosylase-like protein [Paenibacillus sp. W4I10]